MVQLDKISFSADVVKQDFEQRLLARGWRRGLDDKSKSLKKFLVKDVGTVRLVFSIDEDGKSGYVFVLRRTGDPMSRADLLVVLDEIGFK